MKNLILNDRNALSADDQLKNALKLHKEGLLIQAEEIYEKLKNKNPKNIYITYLLGLLYSQTQRPSNAIKNI
jgi:tetratricopeptide (TPR) repeat protein